MGKLLTVLLAAAGGAIAGLLLAPKSGKETRQDLKTKADEYKGKANDSLKDIKKGASSVKDEVVRGAEALGEITKDAADDALRNAERIKDEVSERAKSIRKNAAQSAEDAKRSAK